MLLFNVSILISNYILHIQTQDLLQSNFAA